MKKIPFESHRLEAGESVMDLHGLKPIEIRFKHDTKEIFIVLDIGLEGKSWREIKKLVLESGGEWTNTKEGIHFLMGRES